MFNKLTMFNPLTIINNKTHFRCFGALIGFGYGIVTSTKKKSGNFMLDQNGKIIHLLNQI